MYYNLFTQNKWTGRSGDYEFLHVIINIKQSGRLIINIPVCKLLTNVGKWRLGIVPLGNDYFCRKIIISLR